ncbi:MAG: acyl-CoA/acyl-ACP dehydrogenase, partial [Gammaproteobacteria bacterium]|nr:acyl-CoA/acyl-ACP dehydrogenase [Gammaproteobacteria bacterium]
MDFSYSDKVEDLQLRVQQFMDEYIVPRCTQWKQEVHQGQYPVSFMDDLKA